MRTGSTLTYLLSDHLGSTSLTTDASGNLLSEMRYKAWGEVRYSSGVTPTDYTYTGQYSNMGDFGLMFYNARWYDPALGRFAQADSIVPGGVQGWDRYAYVNNSPLNNVDPTGHEPGTMCDHGYYEYCGRFIYLNNGGVIDVDHFNAARQHGVQIADAINKEDSKIRLKMEGDGVYEKTISLEGLTNDSPELIEQYLEFQQGYESQQLELPIWDRGSAFSPEDIPSDMLGVVAGLNDISLEETVWILGGVDKVYPDGLWRNPAAGNYLWSEKFKDCASVACGSSDYQSSSAKFKTVVPGSNPREYEHQTYPKPFAMLNAY